MKVKIKKLDPKAVIPTYAKPGDAAMDLTAVTKDYDAYGNVVYGTKLAFEIPEGFAGFVYPRSSTSHLDLTLGCSVGIIDSGYRGEVTLKYKKNIRMIANFWWHKLLAKFGKAGKPNIYNFGTEYNIGDRVGQIIIKPIPQIEFEEVKELSETERGTGSYGHTGL